MKKFIIPGCYAFGVLLGLFIKWVKDHRALAKQRKSHSGSL